MKIDTKLNQIEATSQRTVKYIKYFTKNFMTDRLIMVLILLIVCAIVVIIILFFVGGNNKNVYYKKAK